MTCHHRTGDTVNAAAPRLPVGFNLGMQMVAENPDSDAGHGRRYGLLQY